VPQSQRQEAAIRDIRSDLEERAKLIEDETRRTTAHFDKKFEELRREQDARLAELKAELAALSVLLESERRRMASGPPVLHQRTAPGALESDLKRIGDLLMRGEGAASAAPPKNRL
jgi:hypothetical protein